MISPENFSLSSQVRTMTLEEPRLFVKDKEKIFLCFLLCLLPSRKSVDKMENLKNNRDLTKKK
jgi:hypothetical protein